MKSSPVSRRRTLVPALLLLAVAAFVGTRPGGRIAAGGKTSVSRTERVKADRAPSFPMPSSFRMEEDGGGKSYRVSMDEVAFRDASGEDRVVRLDPPATGGSYAARTTALAGGDTVMPVVYPEGEEPEVHNRRFVTSDVLVEVSPDMDRSEASRLLRLPVGSLPAASPRHVVLSAKSPLAALAGLDGWRAAPRIVSANVLLARQQTRRALPNDPLIGQQWHYKYQSLSGVVTGTDINVESAWNYPSATNAWRGNGVRIGIVDDGLQTAHPDLAANVDTSLGKDWNGNDLDPNPGSGDDHGTACAGNAAAVGNNGIGVSGSAPEATLVGMRLISSAATDAQEAEAMSYRNDVIHIKSNSWGPEDNGRTLEAPGTLTRNALADATANGRGGKGTIFVWAGGNGGDVGDNSNYDGYANSIHTIAVGATDSQRARAYYSERGANLVVCAPSSGRSPARDITTVDRTGGNGYNISSSGNGGDYTDDFGGTSSATPTVAGVIAMMLQRNPDLGWRDVQEILIRSANRINGTNSGWAANGAGFRFHHDYGAGLIDATAAVNLAATWTNLPDAATPLVSTQSGLSVAIPDSNTAGITRSFAVTGDSRVEQVTVKLNINHTARGNLEVTLTSPTGMTSRLAEPHTDTNDHYSNWTFMSVRHWGESSAGTWTLNIADRSTSGNSTGGTLTSAELTIHGAPGTPVNPPPVVRITSPAEGATFSPGSTVNIVVDATDTVIGGGAGVVSKVELYDNGVLAGSRTSAPYTFSLTPATGVHSIFAKATDSEGATADSATLTLFLFNQPPVVTAAAIAGPYGYDDMELAVTGVVAGDPDGTTPTISYQWQSSDDGVNFSDVAGLTAPTLPPDPSRSGWIWRCRLVPSDGSLDGSPFFTNGVNLLARPATTAAPGAAYTYQSGLVLRNGGGAASRDAIIQEFSQGPSGGTAEWVEILVLRNADLRGWAIRDSSGAGLVFRNAAVWQNVAAGTLLVVHNGASKDPLLDAVSSSAERRVVASNDGAYFDTASGGWPSLGNSGDAIFLNDAAGAMVFAVGYGNDLFAPMNVGTVNGGKSAYYAGDTDEGADLATNWKVTTSLTARSTKAPRATGDLFISEYVEGTSNHKALEFYNPSAAGVNLASESYTLEIYFNGGTTAGSVIPLSGTVPAGGTFVIAHASADSAILAVAGQISSGSLTFNGNDAIVLKKAGVIIDSFGVVGTNPGTAWTGGGITTVDRTLRRKSTVAQGDTASTDAFDPSVEWEEFPVNTFSGLGSHSLASAGPSLFLSVSPNAFSESAGDFAATATVTLSQAAASHLVVALSSSNTAGATVPANVVIPAGQTSAVFTVAAVDNSDADGSKAVTITATAAGYASAAFIVTVTDDEVALEGVTPGNPNTPENAAWIAAIREGSAGGPALFRLAAGSSLPPGLTLGPATGLISGVIDASAEGTFAVVIERYNNAGEIVSQSFTLEISGSPAPSFAVWIGGFPDLSDSSAGGDPDGDGLANLLEYLLGLSPAAADASGNISLSREAGSISLTYRRSKAVAGVNAAVEWSDTLAVGSWSTSGIVESVIEDNPADQLIRATLPLAPGEPRKFLRLSVVADAP